MLYIVSTPIGNLDDITYRAVKTLRDCDYILCEDTRRSKILLNHLEIQKPLKSFHKFSEAKNEKKILADLESGQHIALISDAGTPGISDPGVRLIRAARNLSLEVTAIPGACAAIAALSLSGFDSERFQFLGFLPKKSGKREKLLLEIFAYPGTTICYESPYRLLKILKQAAELMPDAKLAVARELTKKFEEFRAGTAQELLGLWTERNVKGEIVILFEGKPDKKKA